MPTSSTPTTTSALDANLAALRRSSPAASELIAGVMARPDVTFVDTPSGAISATMEEWTIEGLSSRALASKRDPWLEAERLIDGLDPAVTPVVVVIGFGLGYHVAALAKRLGRQGLVIVFEPDATLLRAVLERIDHHQWLSSTNVLLVTDPNADDTLAEAARGIEGVLAMGTTIIEHPPSRGRLGDLAAQFTASFTRVMQAVRTTVVTTMVQTEATIRNLTQNLDVYATAGGIAGLKDTCPGRAAVVVSAGPSLARNIEQLARPGVRDAVVIIATQTVLKPLLARGIRPHFVTALDFHEISRRFYEGLSATDVEGITLVVEPKVNPAVPAAFPGLVLCSSDATLDRILGPEFARPMGVIPAGATVAHLAYYLARHLGCDPVVLMGQDLGFTDGQYYAAGAAIHDVWAGELNEFNTLEMLEWQRIARMRPILRRVADTQGRAIYTDEQMATYLMQFQRDFKADVDRGLTIIDATEGGVAKLNTRTATLADTLAQHLNDPRSHRTPGTIQELLARGLTSGPTSTRPAQRLSAVVGRVRSIRRDVWQVAKFSRQARGHLADMLEHHDDQPRVNRLIDMVERVRDKVSALQPAFALVEQLNQTGAFNRAKADRRINMGELHPTERQREQISRDLTNVTWLADSADVLGNILDECARALEGGPKRTRDPLNKTPTALPASADTVSAARGEHEVIAVITGAPDTDAWGRPRDLAKPIDGQRHAWSLTLARLARTPGLGRVVVVSRQIDRLRALAGTTPPKLNIEWVETSENDGFDPRLIQAARAFAPHSWRGGLGNLTVYDEVFKPAATLAALDRHRAQAALILGVDWCFADPALGGALITRFHEDPVAHRLTFTQAGPGLAPALVDRQLTAAMSEKRANAGTFASIGGLLGYIPTNPTVDLLAKSMCVAVEAPVRDAFQRLIADDPECSAGVVAALRAGGLDPLHANADAIAQAVRSLFGQQPNSLDHLVIEAIDQQGETLAPATLAAALAQLGSRAARAAITFRGVGRDLLDHPHWRELINVARNTLGPHGGPVHVRTHLRAEPAAIDSLLAAEPEVISVDLMAEDQATYTQVAGTDAFRAVRANMQRLLDARRPLPGGGFSPWIVPRLTRRDAVYEHIEPFFDRWTMLCGWAVIDPLPAPNPRERIAPLPPPRLARERRDALTTTISAQGVARAG